MASVAEALGQPFMPWQRDFADVACEIDPETGLPAYREAVVTVPRQSGKTTLFLAWQLNRCLSPRWSQPQRSVFTAQTGKDARDKFLDELFPLIRKSKKLRPLYARIYEGMGNEFIRFKNGSLIRLLSTSAASGHSKTLHQAVLDEIWHDIDFRREQGLRPAMVTVADAQLLVCSTAGTSASVVLDRKISIGRKAVEADVGHSVAFLEYSAPDGWDLEDEESYFGFMPALCPDPPCRCGVDDGGWRHTVTLDVIRSERLSLEPLEFARAYGNRPTPGMVGSPIDVTAWTMCAVEALSGPPPGPVFFLDADLSWTATSIAGAAVHDGMPHVALADSRPGSAWLVPRAVELRDQYPGTRFAWLKAGLVTSLREEFRNAGIEPDEFVPQEMGRACGHLQKLVADRAITHSGDPLFEAALSVAVRRDIGDDLWTWSRRKSGDISPLVAATGAAWLLESQLAIPRSKVW